MIEHPLAFYKKLCTWRANKKNKTKLKKVLLWYQTESSFKVMEYVMDGVTVSNFWISYYRNTFIEGALAGESAESKTL